MTVYKLDLNDCDDDEYDLLGVHTTLECYHLAYFMNKNFNVKFERKENLDSFEFYEFDDEKNKMLWNIISNKALQKHNNAKVVKESLFQIDAEAVIYLLPEHKKVDYLIKITDNSYDIQNMIDKMKTIPQIITTFVIDVSNLKSKNNLNFY
ncbi:MAG: IPExxxVDY family protein [Flavobacteriaceae bacterium]